MGQCIYKSLVFLPPDPSYEIGTVTQGVEVTSFEWEGRHVPFALVRPVEETPNSQYVILYSHGNAEDLGQLIDLFVLFKNTLGVCVASYDYVGYGPSREEGAEPSERACFHVALAAFQHLTGQQGFDPSSVILYGRSLGSGPTTWLGAKLSRRQVPFAGMVLQSPLTSAIAVVSDFLTHVAADMFENIKRISLVRRPIMIVHGRRDVVVPFAHGQRLAQVLEDIDAELEQAPDASTSSSSDALASQRSRRLFRFVSFDSAGHNDIEIVFWQDLAMNVGDFIAFLREDPSVLLPIAPRLWMGCISI